MIRMRFEVVIVLSDDDQTDAEDVEEILRGWIAAGGARDAENYGTLPWPDGFTVHIKEER